MRLLLAPLAGGVGLGPLTRSLAIAYEARQRGHQVAFLCRDSFARIVRRFDYQVYPAPSPSAYQGIKPPPIKLSDVGIGLGWVEENYIRRAIEVERKTINLFKADIVFTEEQYTVSISAPSEEIPWVATASWADHPNFSSPLYRHDQSMRGLESVFNSVLKDYGQPQIEVIDELAFLRASIKIAATTPQLQPEMQIVPDVFYVGHLLSPEMERGKLPDSVSKWSRNSPVIYVCMAPGEIKPSTWISILIAAFQNTEFKVMVTLAPLKISPSNLPSFPNIKFFKSLPGTTAIQHSDVVITHGGANTVTNALMSGKPVMVFADNYAERDYNGRTVERLGAGINYQTKEFSKRDLPLNARKIISKPAFKMNAQKIGRRIKKFGGARRAVEIIQAFLNKKK